MTVRRFTITGPQRVGQSEHAYSLSKIAPTLAREEIVAVREDRVTEEDIIAVHRFVTAQLSCVNATVGVAGMLALVLGDES